jgi:hypothetical protein
MSFAIGGDMEGHITFAGNADPAQATGAVFDK